tara:strand:+ start:570 stop:1265 length:696 start_codon:yes stop_codon:yes gene_type:complete
MQPLGESFLDAHEILKIDPSRLHPNPWNPNVVGPENEVKIEASIRRNGMFKPVLVRERADGQLEILGGAHRVKVAERMGLASVPVINLGPIDDAQAKEIGLIDNGRYGTDDSLLLADIFRELGADTLVELLPIEMTDVDAIFAATDIDLDSIGFPDEPTTVTTAPLEPTAPPTHQTIKFRVPVKDAHVVTDVIEKIMRTQSFTDDLAEINAGNALLHLITHSAQGKGPSHE